MSKQLKIEEKQPLTICGFKQNCYKVGTSGGVVAVSSVKQSKTYLALERQTLLNGFVDNLVEKDYPITKESVTSYADGADYRNDPAQAVANAPKRVNLGDITEAQEFLSNPQNSMRVYKEVLDKLVSVYAAQKDKGADKPVPATNEKEEDK